ncbi:MAG: bifunctional [glutamate--ammonia ligase]-adenylyl-L-tyrosine phosphorylase/[glutamate--ammonia-ligase] adenylyltransferase, partial [Gammaproteobacteria bacterium PRO8]|nr:bifunctional [glutamate--ammonia ligase]-adenylyl-L-tyrosine phosphorylase/[glutamate--ammonia-ligase] adenylyltransferase [Gammaproteobacteria bacterium PRO8]
MSATLPPVPDSLLAEARQALAALPDGLHRDPGVEARLSRLCAASPFAAGILQRYPELLAELLEGDRIGRANAAGELVAAVAATATPELAEPEFMAGLRRLRHRELLRILWREVEARATVPETLRDLSDLADACIGAALAWAAESLRPRHGSPRLDGGEPCGLGVLGMGKLGGHELNFSSDVDLIFVFSDAGETDGAKPIANEEYFRLLGQRLVNLLGQTTADGFVYRVDVRLRPFGNSGPLAVSLPALETYLMQNGRDWERYAYVKARVVNDWVDSGYFYDDVVRPFVYRRYLDYGVFASLREMKAMIEAEVQRKEFQADIKLGPGGIREIEFIVQSFQLVRGGSVAGLRGREILRLLPALARHGCLQPAAVAGLTAAYLFLRRLENAIQALRDQQTHQVPEDALDRARLALALGAPDWSVVEAELAQHRDTVSRHFRDVVFRGEGGGQVARGGQLRQVWREEAAPEA